MKKVILRNPRLSGSYPLKRAAALFRTFAGNMASVREYSTIGRTSTPVWGVSQLKKVKDMERELTQYKKIVAELTLQNTILKDVIEKKL